VSISAFADPYKPPIISDVSTIEYRSSNLRLSDRSIKLSISYQEESSIIDRGLFNSHNPEYMEALIRSSWLSVKRYMEAYSLPTNDCRYNYNLNIFIVNNSILYDASRFEGFFSDNNGYYSPGVIRGFYDPTVNIKNNSAIILTNVDRNLNELIFVHEMSHYWYDRLCTKRHWTLHDEEFSMRFQEYYEGLR
jgi:hypothetical protein